MKSNDLCVLCERLREILIEYEVKSYLLYKSAPWRLGYSHSALKHLLYDFFHTSDCIKQNTLFYMLRNLFKILFIRIRDNDLFDIISLRGYNFFLIRR